MKQTQKQYSQAQQNNRPSRRKKRRKRRKVILIIEIILLVILLAMLFVWLKFGSINFTDVGKKIKTGDISESTEKTLSGYTNFMVYGVDNRTQGDYDSGRTDVQILVSINNDTKKIRMASVYRDTYLNVNPSGTMKLAKSNEAYNTGGETQALEMINTNFDLDVQNFVSVDFSAVVDVVDAVGGLEVDVSEDEYKALNSRRYPTIPEVARLSGKKATPVTHAGKQTLNGVQTCAYCRIRHGAGDDYGRAMRQRKVMKLLLEKVKGSSVTQLSHIIDAVLPKMYTNFSATDLITLAMASKSYDLDKSFAFPFDKRAMELHGHDYIVPCTLESNVAKLHQKMFDETGYVPSQTVRNLSSQISYTTGVTESSAVDYSKLENNVGIDDSTQDNSTTDSQ